MVLSNNQKITDWLSRTNGFMFCLYASGISFCLYTCVYTFRKTFSVGTFDDQEFGGVSYKVWLVIAQVIGYACSKFIGIKIISELKSTSRARNILSLSAIAILSWLGFAITPAPFNIVFLFTNGLPLGMIWGILFSYLEGRRNTEVLGVGLSISFIFSSGFAKSIGAFTMNHWGTSERWMPFVTSILFVIPLLLFVWLVNLLPPPTPEDIKARTKRLPMNKKDRQKFILTFLPGIVLFILAYVLLTAFRDFRDNFSAELWNTLGYGNSPELFTLTEIPVAVLVLIILGSVMFVKSNRRAFMINHVLIIAGFILIGVSTLLFEGGFIHAPCWMIIVGLGLYLGYVPFNSIFFDRMLATFQYMGTVGFIMYVADSFGYLGSIGVLLFKEFGFKDVSWLQFFIHSGYFLSISGTVLITCSMMYFTNRHRAWHIRNTKLILPDKAGIVVTSSQ